MKDDNNTGRPMIEESYALLGRAHSMMMRIRMEYLKLALKWNGQRGKGVSGHYKSA